MPAYEMRSSDWSSDVCSSDLTVDVEVTVTDDQPVDCDEVTVTYILGHDDHGHPLTTASGCTGSIETTVPSGHDPEGDNLTAVFVAEYTDPGGDGLPSLTGSDEVEIGRAHV